MLIYANSFATKSTRKKQSHERAVENNFAFQAIARKLILGFLGSLFDHFSVNNEQDSLIKLQYSERT